MRLSIYPFLSGLALLAACGSSTTPDASPVNSLPTIETTTSSTPTPATSLPAVTTPPGKPSTSSVLATLPPTEGAIPTGKAGPYPAPKGAVGKWEGSSPQAGAYYYADTVASVYIAQKLALVGGGWEIVRPNVTTDRVVFFIRKGSSGFSVDIASCSVQITDPDGLTTSVCDGGKLPEGATVKVSYFVVGS